MTRGDTFRAKIRLVNRAGESYTPQTGDVITFAAMQKYDDAVPLIEKTIDNDSMELVLDPADTSALPYGSYVYDMDLTYANGDVDTFIDKAILEILEKVPRSDEDAET